MLIVYLNVYFMLFHVHVVLDHLLTCSFSIRVDVVGSRYSRPTSSSKSCRDVHSAGLSSVEDAQEAEALASRLLFPGSTCNYIPKKVRETRGTGTQQKGTWMSQEVSKWLVNGL